MSDHNDEFDFAKVIEEMVSRRPLVYHMTNMVAIGEQANLALAIGASPVMSLYPGEAVELVIAADSLVINIGTPSKEGIEAMFAAAREARELGKPALLDPVGYGATKMRMGLVERLLDTKAFSVVKGNGAEISLLGLGQEIQRQQRRSIGYYKERHVVYGVGNRIQKYACQQRRDQCNQRSVHASQCQKMSALFSGKRIAHQCRPRNHCDNGWHRLKPYQGNQCPGPQVRPWEERHKGHQYVH